MRNSYLPSYAGCPVNLPLLVYNRENEKNMKRTCKILSLRSLLYEFLEALIL